MTTPASARAAGNRRLAWVLLVVAAGSFAFSYALVPLYQTFCELTGLNGKTATVALSALQGERPDAARWVTVEFTGAVMPGLPWRFETPSQRRLRVHPGELAHIAYRAENLSNRALDGQAVMSVTPENAARYFRKIECFCLTRQRLAPGAAREMPLSFYVDPKLPDDVRTITLSYTFFPVNP